MANRGYVLENGRIVLQGESRVLLNDDYIKEAYLGV
jgi:branched-chain amino acid transport system ATP-binding protein